MSLREFKAGSFVSLGGEGTMMNWTIKTKEHRLRFVSLYEGYAPSKSVMTMQDELKRSIVVRWKWNYLYMHYYMIITMCLNY